MAKTAAHSAQAFRCMSILHDRNRPPRLRVRGLPFGARKEDLLEFFKGYKLAPSEDSILMILTKDKKPSGEAFVFFADAQEALRAQREKHLKFLGNRYLELLVDFSLGDPQGWIYTRELSEQINRKRYIGDNR
ncbi:RRM domain-containing protein, putative [Eimeria tenella]|uniref:RRM domain-containing protein, putative n=1 Tax=Eimeria tenella TaxID=5802 RepID=U6KXC8_EIMTE|nr:RRM domain-containing protein, putative [Eimeria tenella]CDJ42621.1 RRM domain-containing protein, putative [Eimeria tenella]|eukprot:XP_013233371.1 RRM domain-containing protein, putative [Eimeria tenella]